MMKDVVMRARVARNILGYASDAGLDVWPYSAPDMPYDPTQSIEWNIERGLELEDKMVKAVVDSDSDDGEVRWAQQWLRANPDWRGVRSDRLERERQHVLAVGIELLED